MIDENEICKFFDTDINTLKMIVSSNIYEDVLMVFTRYRDSGNRDFQSFINELTNFDKFRDENYNKSSELKYMVTIINESLLDNGIKDYSLSSSEKELLMELFSKILLDVKNHREALNITASLLRDFLSYSLPKSKKIAILNYLNYMLENFDKIYSHYKNTHYINNGYVYAKDLDEIKKSIDEKSFAWIMDSAIIKMFIGDGVYKIKELDNGDKIELSSILKKASYYLSIDDFWDSLISKK